MIGTIENNGTMAAEGFTAEDTEEISVGTYGEAREKEAAEAKEEAEAFEEQTEEGTPFDETEGEPEDEEKSDNVIRLPELPEFVGTTVSRATQKLTWERLHLHDGDKKEEASCYDSLLAGIDPASDDKVLNFLISECGKDEGFAEKVLLPHKSLKRCLKVFTETFAKYFEGYLASLPTANIGGRNVPVGCCDDETGFKVIKGYYLIDDREQVEKEKKEEEERKKKAAESKAKIAAAKKSKAKTEPKKDEKKEGGPKKENKTATDQIDLFTPWN